MANTFKNEVGTATTGGATIYTCPSDTKTVVIGMVLSNKTGSSVTADIQVGSTFYLNDAPIPAGSTLDALGGKLVLEATDAIVVTASANSSVDVILSILEIT